MKKKLFLFLLLISVSPDMFSQNFKGGIKIGMCGSQVNGDALSGFNKAGILAGVFVNHSITSAMKLQLEMMYIQKGSRKPTDDNNTFYRLRVTYIEVPLR